MWLPHPHGVLLIVESRAHDGSIMKGSATLVQENGLWKTTSEFAYDEELEQYNEIIPAPDFLTPFSIQLFPEQLDIAWYNWITKHCAFLAP